MSRIFTLLLAATILLGIGCSKDEQTAQLNYDGDPFGAPELPAGYNELGVHFTSSETAQFTGRSLEEIRFFVDGRANPTTLSLKVYGEGTATTPGDLLYEIDLSNRLVIGEWNTHRLPTPIAITGDDLWINIGTTVANFGDRVVGCDQGPRQNGGDWLFLSTDTAWRTFLDRVGDSVNWNIRGIISAE